MQLVTVDSAIAMRYGLRTPLNMVILEISPMHRRPRPEEAFIELTTCNRLGGKDEYKNLQLLHRHCHQNKTRSDGSHNAPRATRKAE